MKVTTAVKLFAMAVLAAIATLPVQADDQAPATAPAPAPEVKKSKWESTATASLTLTRGNSESIMGSLDAKTLRKWGKNELKLGAAGAYGETTERTGTAAATTNTTTVSVNAISGYLQYNRLFSEQIFGYVRADGLHDDIAGIDYRFVISPGLGHYLIKKPATTLCVEIGPSYVIEKLDGVEDDYATLRVSDTFTHKFNDRAKIWQMTEVLPALEDFSKILVNTEVGVSASLTKNNKLALTVTLNHKYNSQPGQDPTKPKRMKNDTILKAGITCTF
jgi:putative salt-induced outer membrane protein YdiY